MANPLRTLASAILCLVLITAPRISKSQELIKAVWEGDQARAAKLLEKAPNSVNETDSAHWTPLITAVVQDNLPIVELLLSKGADPKLTDGGVWTALHYAALVNNVQIAKVLIKKGALVDAVENFNWTPLFVAAAHGKKEMVEFLLSIKANPNTVAGNTNTTILYQAQVNGHLDIVRLLKKYGANYGMIWMPAR